MLLSLTVLVIGWGDGLRKKPRTFVGQFVMASWPRDFVAG
jgi:hypothetical protein